MCTFGSFQKNLVPDDSIVSRKQLLSEPGLSEVSSGFHWGTHSGVTAFPDSSDPREAQLQSSCAIGRSLPSLCFSVPITSSDTWSGVQCVCFGSRLENLARRSEADLGRKITVQRQ